MAKIITKTTDLRSWKEESYKAGSADWKVSANGEQVVQSKNGDPTFFYSDFTVFNTKVSGKIIPGNSGDDDFIGFALGFNPGDTTNQNANFILIDWKKGTQAYGGGTANLGLAVSLVSGVPPLTPDIWGHTGKVKELARAMTLGARGWTNNIEYKFDFVYTKSNLRIFVNDILEFDVNGNFSEGRIAFYNYSQDNVTYKGFETKIFPSGQIDVPANLETGLEFPNPLDQGEAKVKLTPSGNWSVKSDKTVTCAGEPGAKLLTNVMYPNNTPYCLVVLDKATGQVLGELGTEKIMTIKAGQTIIFKMNDEPGWYWDNTGSITVDWTVVE